jgi:hypothetical protein
MHHSEITPAAPAESEQLSVASRWPTGWLCVVGGILFCVPYALGFLDALGLSAAKAPMLRFPAFLSLTIAVGLLLLSLYGWWSLTPQTARRGAASSAPAASWLARAGIVVLAVAFALWLLDLLDNVLPGGMPFYVGEDVFAILVAIGSALFALGFWLGTRLSRSGVLLVGVCGVLAMALLVAPWPLGLGPVVPALAIAYGVGWLILGRALTRMRREP